MVIEFQIARGKLEDLFHNRLLVFRPCVSAPVTYNNETYYVARLTLGATSLFTDPVKRPVSLYRLEGPDLIHTNWNDIDVPALRITQEVSAHVVSLPTLITANQHPTTLIEIPFTVILDLAVGFDPDGVPWLCASVHDVQGLTLGDPAAQQQLLDFMKNAAPVCSKIELDSLSALLQTEPLKVVNAGIALHANGERVAIRLDTHPNPPTPASSWSVFYAGNFSMLGSGQDWAVLVPSEILVTKMPQFVSEGLVGQEDKFSLQSGPDAAWVAGDPAATVTLSGEVIDACIDIDVNVDVTLGVTFSAQPPTNIDPAGRLRITVTIEWDQDNTETFGCALVTATFWPIVGAVILSEEKIDWWHYIVGFGFGPAAFFFSLIGYLSSDELASFIPPFPGWLEVSDTERYMELPFPDSLGGLAGGIKLTNAEAHTAGLLLSGAIATPAPALQDLQAQVTGFGSWVLQNPCNQPNYQVTAHIKLGPITAPSAPLVPIHVCYWTVVDDDLGQYSDWERVSELDFKFTVKLPLKPGFNYIDPDVATRPGVTVAYPLKVLILTSDGARFITIPPPPPPPEPIEDPLEQIALQLWQVIHCTRYASIWDELHTLNPEWLIDPPPEQEVAQLWAVTVNGMPEGDAFVLRDARGLELVTAFADARGFAHATAFAEQKGVGITIAKAGLAPAPNQMQTRSLEMSASKAAPKQSLAIKQTLLVRAATIPLSGALERLSFVHFRGAPTIFLRTSAGPAAYGLAQAERPQRLALRNGSRAWETAPAWLTRVFASSPPCDNAATVRDVIRRAQRIYLVRDRAVEVIDERGCLLGELSVSHGNSIAEVGDLIVVGTASGLAIVEPDAAGARHPVNTIAFDASRGVVSAKLAHARRAVYVRALGLGGSVIDLRDPVHPVELARYRRRPWYVDGGRLGRVLVRTADDDRHVVVYRVGESIGGFERPPTAQEFAKRDADRPGRR